MSPATGRYRTGSGEMLTGMMVGDVQFAFDNSGGGALDVNKASQVIAFTPPSTKTLGDLPFDHNVETFVEGVAARRKNAMRVPLEVLRLAFIRAGAEIHRVGAPHGQQRGDMWASIWTDG